MAARRIRLLVAFALCALPGCASDSSSQRTTGAFEQLNASEAERLAAAAVESLIARYPALAPITVGSTGPVYVDDGRDVVAVSVDLHLARLTNLTMDLVAARFDDDGEMVPIPQLAEIKNLRGLSAHVSRSTGEIIFLVPLPAMGESEHPDQATRVHHLIPEQLELPDD